MPNISSTTGIVYIVGGGPGDPGLITVKGLGMPAPCGCGAV